MRHEPQMLDDIIVPDIEITEGWAVSEVESAEDCDDAFAFLMSAVAEIEYKIDLHALGVAVSPDPTWRARAGRALKYKKAALQLVGHKRGRVEKAARMEMQATADRQLLDHIKASVSHLQFRTWLHECGMAKPESEAA